MTFEQKIAKAKQMHTVAVTVAKKATTLTDDEALSMPDLFPVWPDGVNAEGNYVQGQYITHKGHLYQIKQTTVKPIESQPPDKEGMLAVYRPVDTSHAGTKEDPIPWVYGMDCFTGKYYSYNGETYKCLGDMTPCIWYPGQAGVHQWEKVA